MAKQIWKFRIADLSATSIKGPGLGKFIHFGESEGVICIWAEVKPGSKAVERKFCVIGTGHDIPVGYAHIASCIAPPFVWHLYVPIVE